MDANRSKQSGRPPLATVDHQLRVNAACDSLGIAEAQLMELVREGFYGRLPLEFNLQDGYVESVRAVGVEQTFRIERRAA